MTTISIKIPRSYLEYIDKICGENKIYGTRSEFIREAIRWYIMKLSEKSETP